MCVYVSLSAAVMTACGGPGAAPSAQDTKWPVTRATRRMARERAPVLPLALRQPPEGLQPAGDEAADDLGPLVERRTAASESTACSCASMCDVPAPGRPYSPMPVGLVAGDGSEIMGPSRSVVMLSDCGSCTRRGRAAGNW